MNIFNNIHTHTSLKENGSQKKLRRQEITLVVLWSRDKSE